jgi:hypothetical protein
VISLLVRKKVRRLARHSEAQPPTGPGRAEAGQEHAWQGRLSSPGTAERAATASRP